MDSVEILRMKKDGQVCTDRTKDWWMSEWYRKIINLHLMPKNYIKIPILIIEKIPATSKQGFGGDIGIR